jgi:hypothetical protein
VGVPRDPDVSTPHPARCFAPRHPPRRFAGGGYLLSLFVLNLASDALCVDQLISKPHFIVGMTNSAPSLVPEGQRDVTVLVCV